MQVFFLKTKLVCYAFLKSALEYIVEVRATGTTRCAAKGAIKDNKLYVISHGLML